MTERLTFNGINAATGSYGLSPMTPEALAQHILDSLYSERAKLKQLEETLRRRHDNDARLLQIIQLLVEDNVYARTEALESVPMWLDRLARRLAPLLFGSQHVRPGDIAELAYQLKLDPSGTIQALARGLTKGFSRDLAERLLAQPDDNQSVLSEYLKHTFQHEVFTIKEGWLARPLAQSLRTDAVQRKHWQQGLVDALRRLPVASLSPLAGDLNLVTHPARRLITELASSGQVITHGTHVATWIRELSLIIAQGREASWSALIQCIDDALDALSAIGERVTWEPLLLALDAWLDALLQMLGHQGVVEWVDPLKLSQAGWGVIFPARMDVTRRESIKERLIPLLEWRQEHAGSTYRIYEGGSGYRPNDTAGSFLQRHGARAADPANPDFVPYYLLLIGSPEEIPFEFQYQLDVQYAVGRLDFGDELDAYRRYAENVVASEQAGFQQAARAVFFAVRNPQDAATAASTAHLVQPLCTRFMAKTQDSVWQVDCITTPEATKAALLNLFRQPTPPAVLFTASHGIELSAQDPRQRRLQGALLCQEWDGSPGEIPSTAYVSADDITQEVNLQGAILFFFACHGAGTPRYDEYHRQAFKDQGTVIADPPFVAALPQALLALRDRGALAVIGHVERAWGLSFLGTLDARPTGMAERRHEYVDVFESALERLLKGHPVGSALEYFNMRYAALATELASLYESIPDTLTVQHAYQLAELWTAHNDARGYIILGDPAVRLRAALSAGLGDATTNKALG